MRPHRDMRDQTTDQRDASGLRVALAVSRYHEAITGALRAAAEETFRAAGGGADDLLVAEAPGSFELVALARALAVREDVDAVVAIGCIVRGETSHDQVLAQAIAGALAQLTLETGKPIAFGVLTCQTLHQARQRAGGDHGNKGTEAMAAAIAAVRAIRALPAPGARPAGTGAAR